MNRVLPFFLLIIGCVFAQSPPGDWIISEYNRKIYVNPKAIQEYEGSVFLIVDDKLIATSGIMEDSLGVYLIRPAQNDIIMGTRDYRLILCRECRRINDTTKNKVCRGCGVAFKGQK